MEVIVKKVIFFIIIMSSLKAMEQQSTHDPCIYVGQVQLVGIAYPSESLYNNRIKILKQKLQDKLSSAQEKALQRQIIVSELINRKLDRFIKQKITRTSADIAQYIPNIQDIDRSLRNKFSTYSVLKKFMTEVLHPLLLSRFTLFEPATGFIAGLFKGLLPSMVASSHFIINNRVVPLFHEYLSLCEQYGIFLLSPDEETINIELLQVRLEALELAFSRLGIQDITGVLSLYIYAQPYKIQASQKVFYEPHYLGSFTTQLSALQARAKTLSK